MGLCCGEIVSVPEYRSMLAPVGLVSHSAYWLVLQAFLVSLDSRSMANRTHLFLPLNSIRTPIIAHLYCALSPDISSVPFNVPGHAAGRNSHTLIPKLTIGCNHDPVCMWHLQRLRTPTPTPTPTTTTRGMTTSRPFPTVSKYSYPSYSIVVAILSVADSRLLSDVMFSHSSDPWRFQSRARDMLRTR